MRVPDGADPETFIENFISLNKKIKNIIIDIITEIDLDWKKRPGNKAYIRWVELAGEYIVEIEFDRDGVAIQTKEKETKSRIFMEYCGITTAKKIKEKIEESDKRTKEKLIDDLSDLYQRKKLR